MSRGRDWPLSYYDLYGGATTVEDHTTYRWGGYKHYPGVCDTLYLYHFNDYIIQTINSMYSVNWKNIPGAFVDIGMQYKILISTGKYAGHETEGGSSNDTIMAATYVSNPVDITDPTLTRHLYDNGNVHQTFRTGENKHVSVSFEIIFGYQKDPNYWRPWWVDNIMYFPTMFKFTITVDPNILVYPPTEIPSDPDPEPEPDIIINSISPNSIMSSGLSKITISGTNLLDNSELERVRLSKSNTAIEGSIVSASSNNIVADFYMQNASPGYYTVIIHLKNGRIGTKPDAISVTQVNYFDNCTDILITPRSNITTSTELVLFTRDNSRLSPSYDVNFGPETIHYSGVSGDGPSHIIGRYTYALPGNYELKMFSWGRRNPPYYAQSGNTIFISVTDDTNNDDNDDIILPPIDDPRPPIVSLKSSSSNEKVVTLSIKNGDVSNVSWNFGDGTIKNGRTVVHEYTRDGTYNISVTYTR